MKANDLTRMLDSLKAEQAEAEAQLAQLQHRVASLRQAVSGIEGLLQLHKPDESASVGESMLEPARDTAHASPNGRAEVDRPTSTEAVRRVLVETRKPWTVKAMTEELNRRGWSPKSNSPEDAVRTAMARAWRADSSDIIRLPEGYIFRPQEPSSSAATAPNPDKEGSQ
jgi:hypothetical protein